MFVVDLSHLGVISVTGPHTDSVDPYWNIEATNGTVTWVLAEAPSHVEAVSIQRRLFISLSTGEKAVNMNANRRQMQE